MVITKINVKKREFSSGKKIQSYWHYSLPPPTPVVTDVRKRCCCNPCFLRYRKSYYQVNILIIYAYIDMIIGTLETQLRINENKYLGRNKYFYSNYNLYLIMDYQICCSTLFFVFKLYLIILVLCRNFVCLKM